MTRMASRGSMKHRGIGPRVRFGGGRDKAHGRHWGGRQNAGLQGALQSSCSSAEASEEAVQHLAAPRPPDRRRRLDVVGIAVAVGVVAVTVALAISVASL